jgi:hypothetical protein
MAAETLQELVDSVFRDCMKRDVRDLELLRKAVRAAFAQRWGVNTSNVRPGMATDHALQIAISRNCMGEGEWEFYPAYSNPPRYVSRARVLELAQREVTQGLDVWERQELDAQLADLEQGIAHWKAKHQRARDKVEELDALIQRARHHPMEALP